MKKLLGLLLLVFAALLIVGGCDDNNNTVVADRDPIAPQGVYTVTGDGMVRVYWNGVYDPDVAEYAVWRSRSAQTGYQEIARVQAQDNPNQDLLIYHYDDFAVTNGETYWYAVSSVNGDGVVSDLSAEEAFDTPRPDGLGFVTLNAATSDFDFHTGLTIPAESPGSDVFLDAAGGVLYLNAADTLTDIQDMGYTDNFDDISYAPANGWSQLGFVEVIQGHIYVVWTSDNRFAKLRVTSIASGPRVNFEWGFQTDAGNPELIAPLQRPVHGPNYLKKQSASDSQQQ